MKKILILMAMAFMVVFSPSCDNEINLTDEWKDIPIVYGLLSRADTAHYIRVEKAFLDPNSSALDIAQIPDSLYYDNVSVQLQKVNSNDPPYIFQRVDGNAEGYVREAGIFANAPNYLYKLKLPTGEEFEAGATYELQIDRGDNFEMVTAITEIVHDIRILEPAPKDPPDVPLEIKWEEYDKNVTVRWRAKDSAKFFDLVMVLHILEVDQTNPSNTSEIELVWEIEKNIPAPDGNSQGDLSETISISVEEFFRFIGSKLDAKPGFSRKFESMDVMIRAGGEELLEYVNVGLVNTGITSSQVIPTYTNLSEGFGLFSSRNQIIEKNYPISGNTVDSLINGIYTNDLNFTF